MTGNPAAVVLFGGREWPPDDTLKAIAGENNLSETAFLLPARDGQSEFRLRWWTPQTEVSLCGHGTLAAGHVALDHLFGVERPHCTFITRSGVLRVMRVGERLAVDLPRLTLFSIPTPPGLVEAIGAEPVECWRGNHPYLFARFEREEDVRRLRPDFRALRPISPGSLCVTAPADSREIDFVSRFFAPAVGISEDPVTGSTHGGLGPLWQQRLGGKTRLEARQLSARGGALAVEVKNDREVRVIGGVVTVGQGHMRIR